MGTSRLHAAIKGKQRLFICLGQRALNAELLIRKILLPGRYCAVDILGWHVQLSCLEIACEANSAGAVRQSETDLEAGACCAQMRMRPYRMRVQRKADATTPKARNCSPLLTMAMDSAHSCPARAGPSARMPAASMFPKPLTGPMSSIGAVKFTKIILHEAVLALANVSAEYKDSAPEMKATRLKHACGTAAIA